MSILLVVVPWVTGGPTRIATAAAMKANEGADAAIAIAERSATSSEEQVEISRRSTERQLRAYVGVASIETRPAGDSHYACRFMVKNYGLTPAHKCTIFVAAKTAQFPLLDPKDGGPEPKPQGNDITLYPSAEIAGYAACDFENHSQQFENEELAVYVYGYVQYDDSEGINRRSNFAYRGTGGVFVRSGEMHPCLLGNSAT